MENGDYPGQYDEVNYMEQEEEWEREGLLDPAWEKQQKKVSDLFKTCLYELIYAFIFGSNRL